MNAITVQAGEAERLAVRRVVGRAARPGEVTVRVTAISLNRGEVKRALTETPSGTTPGWDFAGVVEATGGAPGAPSIGTRVVGLLPVGSWAERVHAPVDFIAPVPDDVTDAQAASLPVAGLTALHALRKGGLLLGRKVLVKGATGGVGQFAIQLAAASGAAVFAHVRREEQQPEVERASTGGVIVGETLEAARAHGPYDFILDSVGGSAVSAALTMLRRSGTCVTVGVTEGTSVSRTTDANSARETSSCRCWRMYSVARRVCQGARPLAGSRARPAWFDQRLINGTARSDVALSGATREAAPPRRISAAIRSPSEAISGSRSRPSGRISSGPRTASCSASRHVSRRGVGT